jgi:hypothetical protein
MSWRHIYNKPFARPVGHPLKRFGHFLVVRTRYKGWPRCLYKFDKFSLAKLTLFELLQFG